MPEFHTIKNPNGSVLISECKKGTPIASGKHYIAQDETKVDAFIKTKKGLDTYSKLRKLASVFVGINAGIIAFGKLKSFKIVGSIAAGIATLAACLTGDYYLDKFLQNKNMKRNNVQQADVCFD